jgi:hypothetical protein
VPDFVEQVFSNGTLLACVVRRQMSPDATTFVTQPELNLQVGFVVYPAGGEVQPHAHRPIDRHIVGTSEVLIVKRGRCVVDVYNGENQLVASPVLETGDLIVVLGHGHGCRMLEDTVLLEVKQGPYLGPDEKVLLRSPRDRDRS